MHDWLIIVAVSTHKIRTIVAVSTVLTAGVKMLSEINKYNLKKPNPVHWLFHLRVTTVFILFSYIQISLVKDRLYNHCSIVCVIVTTN